MGIDRDMLRQLQHLLRPLATRVANTVARAVIHLADDDKKLQLLQLGVLAGETVGDGEHHQPYGFSSVPLGGAEAVVVFPNGDRSHPLVVAVSDRRYRPTGGAGGEVTMYHYKGAKVRMLESGDIEITPGPSGKVLVADVGGTPVELALKSDVEAVDEKYATHIHNDSTSAATKGPVRAGTITPSGGSPPFIDGTALADADIVGTSILLGK